MYFSVVGRSVLFFPLADILLLLKIAAMISVTDCCKLLQSCFQVEVPVIV
jgi:hypothetical protein